MDLRSFTVEAEQLARPAALLRDVGDGAPQAYWHEAVSRELCISVARGDLWLNVYLDADAGGHVEESEAPITSKIALFGTSFLSLPPVDGVFLHGSEVIARFLSGHDWPRTEPFNDNFPSAVPGEYEAAWQANCPLYRSGIAAAMGGWHMPWPDGDWYDLVDHELVVWTFRDAEPWVEVFLIAGEYVVKQRIT